MNNKPYMIIESGTAPPEKQNRPLSFGFSEWYAAEHKKVIYDCFIEDMRFEALLWDYFYQHFYEWVRL